MNVCEANTFSIPIQRRTRTRCRRLRLVCLHSSLSGSVFSFHADACSSTLPSLSPPPSLSLSLCPSLPLSYRSRCPASPLPSPTTHNEQHRPYCAACTRTSWTFLRRRSPTSASRCTRSSSSRRRRTDAARSASSCWTTKHTPPHERQPQPTLLFLGGV